MATAHLRPLVRYIRRVGDRAAEASDRQLLERFASGGDPAAFAALLGRHGPMVLGVCRRVLADEHAAEDAFQVTFLVLAQKGGTLRRPEQLGSWLYGVAYRTARKARARAARRRERPLAAAGDPPVPGRAAALGRDERSLLDDAVRSLPAKYRVPVVLCYLESRTNAEAARRLGLPVGTVATRLARGRDMLRRHLARRGITAPVCLFPAARVPAPLADATCRAAAALTSGGTLAAGVLSENAIALWKGVSPTMGWSKFKIAAAVLISAGAVGSTAGLAVLVSDGALWAARSVTQTVSEMSPAPAEPASEPTPDQDLSAQYLSPNFHVAAPTVAVARRVAEEAENQRRVLARAWTGREAPAWRMPCSVSVRLTGRDTQSHTAFEVKQNPDHHEVTRREMALEGPLDRVLASLLPHEVTHTILADVLAPGNDLPRWADEGAAALAEDAQDQARYEALMRHVREEGRGIPLRSLFGLKEYGHDVAALYAQGHSLVRFLVGQRDRQTFLKFVADGVHYDWDKAVRRYYLLDGVDGLEKAWLATTPKADPPILPNPERRPPNAAPPLPSGVPAPFAAAASATGDFRVDSAQIQTYVLTQRDGKEVAVPVALELQGQLPRTDLEAVLKEWLEGPLAGRAFPAVAQVGKPFPILAGPGQPVVTDPAVPPPARAPRPSLEAKLDQILDRLDRLEKRLGGLENTDIPRVRPERR
jgi:RNA polymerase sigma factor (sigma-70 family)